MPIKHIRSGFKAILTFFLSTYSVTVIASTSPPASLACTSKVGGEWNFGDTPAACSVEPLQKASEVLNQYPQLFFDDAKTTKARVPYMSAMYPVLRDIGAYYIRRRNPAVAADQVQAFTEALFVLAHQESFWTHYRLGADKTIRYMRGDSTHGHGIMQIDDRSHIADLIKGKGVDLVRNIILGLDIFYSEWQRAEKASCVSSPTNYRDRTRAAWAAYNGGSGSICRWTNSSSVWAANDRGFLQKYNSRTWLSFVANTTASSSIDIFCMAEGKRPCAAPVARLSPLRIAP